MRETRVWTSRSQRLKLPSSASPQSIEPLRGSHELGRWSIRQPAESTVDRRFRDGLPDDGLNSGVDVLDLHGLGLLSQDRNDSSLHPAGASLAKALRLLRLSS